MLMSMFSLVCDHIFITLEELFTYNKGAGQLLQTQTNMFLQKKYLYLLDIFF